ncbi:hypothetical protein C7N43_34515 [Sphingobacteriales bacterium UPWRP_1]|nr:hypothetical protein C7N43_34515 [Sphingobacteriales bacterium UPWRP_1]
MKKALLKQLLEWILPFIKDNILKFEKQLYSQMKSIELKDTEENVVFMVYAQNNSLRGALGVLEQATDTNGDPILKLGRSIHIQGQEELNFTELLIQFTQLDNNLILDEAQKLPETIN